MEKRYIQRDGVPVWVSLRGSLTRDPAGNPAYFAAESLADILAMVGHVVEVAFDGTTALEKARANPPRTSCSVISGCRG
jgi:hypothetical protein